MLQEPKVACPDCADMDRREFVTAAVGAAALAAGFSAFPAVARAADTPAKTSTPSTVRPAEELIKELWSTLAADQKKNIVLPYDHGTVNGKGQPTRQGMYNSPIMGKKIADCYTKPQQELCERIVKAMCSGDEGFARISRNGKWDSSGSLVGCGGLFFGEVGEGKDWCWVFAGHHLTIRCDGKLTDGVGFGGPMYYGHSADGDTPQNVFFFQTKSVRSVYEALNETQRKKAVIGGSPGEQIKSVQFRAANQPKPGISMPELTKDQKELVEVVMRDVLSPYRKEDANEVMDVIKKTGGLDKIHLAFYRDPKQNDDAKWHFWRLEGPGFIWNYRILPHVHTFVNISSKLG
jgi:hypothetical protein